jgi:hypothetical protein
MKQVGEKKSTLFETERILSEYYPLWNSGYDESTFAPYPASSRTFKSR